MASIEFVAPSLEWPRDQDRLVLRLRFVNRSGSPLWLNKRAGPGRTTDFDTELTIDLKPVTGRLTMGESSSDRLWAKPEDYVVVPAGQSVELSTKIHRLDYILTPGKYELRVCLWDRNSRPPPAPGGATRFERAIASKPVTLVRL